MATLSKPRRRSACYPWTRPSTKSVGGQIGGTYSNEESNSRDIYSTRGAPYISPFLSTPDIPTPELFALPRCFDSPSVVNVTPSSLKVILNSKLSKYRKEQLLWFAHDLISMGGCKEEGAPINSKFVHHRIGKHTLADSRDIELIVKVSDHSAGNFSSRYRLIVRSNKRKKYKLTYPKLIARRGSVDNYQKSRLKAAGVSPKLLDCLSSFTAPPAFLGAFTDYMAAMDDDGKDTASMLSLFNFIKEGQHRLSVKRGRLTNEIVGLPSYLRGLLLADGSPVAEVDIASSHPQFLAQIFRPQEGDEAKEYEDQGEEHASFIKLLDSRKFYETFEDCWLRDRELFKDYCHKGVKDPARVAELEAKFVSLEPRKGIKLCWQTILNGKGNPVRLFKSRTWKKFSTLFPIMARRMASMKRANPSALGQELRKQEAAFVNLVAVSLEKPVATLYDGWLVAEGNAEALRKLCCDLSSELFGFIINPTIDYSPAQGFSSPL
jgi:hypothetical protein